MTESQQRAAAGWRSVDPEQLRVAFLVAGCFFMEMLDGTIVVTSTPKIASALHVSVGSVSLVMTAYLITLAVFVPLSGWTAARIGGKRTFMAAIAMFTLTSVGCALSTSLPELVGMRVLQGASGAMMVPVGRLIVLSQAAKSDLIRILNYLVWPGLVSPVIAPLAGGLITTYLDWHWLFLINVPLGMLAFAIAARIVRSPALDEPGKLDGVGLVLTSVGLGGLTFTADLLAEHRTNWSLVAAIAGPSLVLVIAAIRHLRRASRPLVDLRPLHIHTFRSALKGSLLYFTVINSGPFLAPLMFEDVFGWSAVKAGAVVLFIFVGNVASKAIVAFIYTRFGFKSVLTAATGAMAVGMTAVGLTTAATPVVVIVGILLVIGSARSIGASGYTTVVFSDVPDAEMRHANTLQLTVQQLGVGSGVAAGAIALRLGQPIGGIFSASPSGHLTYAIAFGLMACLSLLATVEALRMHPGSGDRLRGGRQPAREQDTVPEPA